MTLPVAILLIIMGTSAFIYARGLLLAQWREAATLKLQRAAHEVDMNLDQIKEAVRMFHDTSGAEYSDMFHAWALEYISRKNGVVQVHLSWHNEDDQREAGSTRVLNRERPHQPMRQAQRMRRFHSARIRQITPPRFDTRNEHGTVSLISDLNDENGRTIGQLDVVVDFSFIFQHVIESGWWQSTKAFLVDDSGEILMCTDSERQGRLGSGGDSLEQATLRALASGPSGTLLGPGHPPEEVSGYQRLHEAPWSLIMIAPGREILAPIIELRLIFIVAGIGFIAIIIALIRWVTLRTTRPLKDVSNASLKLAAGEFGGPLPVRGHDEVAELTRSFNTMTAQLKERSRMKEAMTLAMEVQQHFLPFGMPKIPGIDIAARSIYCDETGGDFYDFIETSSGSSSKIGIVVGDGSGHGISAALLMASVRAALRSHAAQLESPADVVSEVNRLVSRDTEETGHFMTLFFIEFDMTQKKLRWVRAGHEPALLMDPAIDGVEELKGEGIAVGVDAHFVYRESTHEWPRHGQVLFIGTDGISETQNASNERFGTERLAGLLREGAHLSSNEIADRILAALKKFRGHVKQQDDVTLVVAKARG
jgi:sigma-B regulation protein RsbU (phosphoserine phosphatase)